MCVRDWTCTLKRRVYYDHEAAYQAVAARGGRGWDDLTDAATGDSYDGVREFVDRYPTAIAGAAVLDLGCGGGQAGLLLTALARRIVGVDYAETAVRLARANASPEHCATYRVGDCTALDVPARSFDVVLDNHTLHCLVRPEHRKRCLQHAADALRPGGLMWSETMSREGGFEAGAFDVDPRSWVNASQTRLWVAREAFNAELADAGFEIVEQRLRPQADRPNPGDLLWTVATPACR